jgi:hypothetical protein
VKVDAKLAIAGAALVIIAILVAVNMILSSGSPVVDRSKVSMDETFHASDFIYGPQASVPYSYDVPFVPGSDTADGNLFRLMIVDLNLTSRSGGSPMGAGPAVIDYAFKGLQGAAAFHVYGFNQGSGRDISWMNRPDGSTGNGYYVFGASSPASTQSPGNVLGNFGYAKVANRNGPVFNINGNGTYRINFDTPGKGLNALRFSQTPEGSGEITCTTNQSGRFYITYDSGNGFDDVLLLVAVNGTLTDDFELHLKAGLYNDSV